ncbi:hypothetical protein [Austwickia chelonae]|uniref:GHMP family kinase ATP-binding protein n=1 Tax=Austwickia chelonae TaxID=100225 RepID=UPI000E286C3C|nr:hypothetical protein [Austwickia chelonae]
MRNIDSLLSILNDPPGVTFLGECCGTIGELWQGPVSHQGEERVGIVSYPGSRRSRVTFAPPGNHTSGIPLGWKSRKAAELFAEETGLPVPRGQWLCWSDLPEGRGMSSSSADIVATLRCLTEYHGLIEDTALYERVMSRIERSDPVFAPTPRLYLTGAHHTVSTFPSPGMACCYFHHGRAVNTCGVSEKELLLTYATHRRRYQDSLAMMAHGLSAGDLAMIGEASTTSALLAQHHLPNPAVGHTVAVANELGALGVFRAHTGSLVGMLFDADAPPRRDLVEEALITRVGPTTIHWEGHHAC